MTMVLLCCHGVYDSETDEFFAEHSGDRPIYEAQLQYAAAHVRWLARNDPMLVISGGPTKKQRQCSESRSYLDLAEQIGLKLPTNTVLEEYALTSIENLLFGAYVYRQQRGCYPTSIHAVTWSFKESRMTATVEAINEWRYAPFRCERFAFFPVGNLSGHPREKADIAEKAYVKSLRQGIEAYYAHSKVQRLIRERDVWNSRTRVGSRYSPLPFPTDVSRS